MLNIVMEEERLTGYNCLVIRQLKEQTKSLGLVLGRHYISTCKHSVTTLYTYFCKMTTEIPKCTQLCTAGHKDCKDQGYQLRAVYVHT